MKITFGGMTVNAPTKREGMAEIERRMHALENCRPFTIPLRKRGTSALVQCEPSTGVWWARSDGSVDYHGGSTIGASAYAPTREAYAHAALTLAYLAASDDASIDAEAQYLDDTRYFLAHSTRALDDVHAYEKHIGEIFAEARKKD